MPPFSCLCYEYVKPIFATAAALALAGLSTAAFAKAIGEFSPYADAPKRPARVEPEVLQPSPVLGTPAEAEAEPPPPVQEAKLPDAYAEPISPQTVARFRHLKAYQGHLVIGGTNLQVVLAGVPAKEPAPGWQPTVLAVFERQDGRFRRSAALETIELKSPLDEATLFPIGVDLGMEKEAKLAYVTQVYAASDPKVGRQTMTWAFDASTSTLAVSIGEFGGGAKPSKSPGKWRVRLTGERAETVAGKGYWLRASDLDVVTFFPYRSLVGKVAQGALELEAPAGEAPPVEGFELLLGRDASANALVRAASLADCLHGTQRPRKPLKEEARLGWVRDCQANTRKSTLRLNAAKTDSSQVVRPVYVFASDGMPVLYTALAGAKDTVDLILPVADEQTYQLADTSAGRLIPGTHVVAPVEGQVKTVELPGQPTGLVRLTPGASKAAAILTLRRLDRSHGEDAGVLAAGDGDSQLRLSASRFLIRSWPADLELESGGYDLIVSRGGEGRVCEARVRVTKQRRVVVGCDRTSGVKVQPNALSEVTYLDLASAEGRDLPIASIRQALGVDLLAEPVEDATNRASPLKVLRTEDEATGITLSFVPATTVLATRWDRLKQAPGQQDLSSRFVRLMRGEGGAGVLELGCPGPGISPFEYELLVQKLQPDAVRLFGCQSVGPTDWLALYDKLASSRRAPLLLTSESGLKMPGERASRLMIRQAPKTSLQKPETAIAAVLAGTYEISAGGGVTLTKVLRTPKTGMVADVAYEALSERVPTVLALYGDKGLIKEERIPPHMAAQGTLSIPLLRSETTWLRAELRADDGVLATTPAVRVAQLIPKEGESH